MTYYELWQKEKYGNILPTVEPDESYEEDLRLAEFMETMAELQLREDEN